LYTPFNFNFNLCLVYIAIIPSFRYHLILCICYIVKGGYPSKRLLINSSLKVWSYCLSSFMVFRCLMHNIWYQSIRSLYPSPSKLSPCKLHYNYFVGEVLDDETCWILRWHRKLFVVKIIFFGYMLWKLRFLNSPKASLK